MLRAGSPAYVYGQRVLAAIPRNASDELTIGQTLPFLLKQSTNVSPAKTGKGIERSAIASSAVQPAVGHALITTVNQLLRG